MNSKLTGEGAAAAGAAVKKEPLQFSAIKARPYQFSRHF